MRLLEIPPFFRPSVALRNKNRLPAQPGVYYAIQWWNPFKPIYIGVSSNIQARWNSRRWGEHHKFAELSRRFGVRLHYRVTSSESQALRIEAIEIRRYRPELNRKLESLRKDPIRDVLDFCADSVLIGVAMTIVVVALWRLLL
ncbi:XRE family transcriptional regulator [Leptolyngbya boryana NIES-2135]|jgi:excinuclease UvrABC nuclease subunit|uniref:XRE family transcriptional regulator n=1 Tax=Leptolyngbya boryana NIES-2135 TaxID=1973484 RepID=A0A1Z4JPC3_LEPBY|nr:MULTISPECIES: GIY-YIG nuclease family protein [Leptolyngbya]BAY58507.1 XRE family transcriptional regulator [Leptolyngbya boryana NIES-2135]MBD2370981.1 GIY-YIG nuclease family protein [Leptolyngbya sp. FACHB-161]MBD2377495.1 GIY-YIG nuclease family protein [Leptolyngbya sp. FACHB-238]MBD2401904.1 GIY-YIG nuclease family protein [Leptolyngbya sp. FACHB-239]MBD2408421.1 GIY-YIG nuclease family protein [Leptolyngbya sp. FACHB-402]